MKILALETSTQACSAALLVDGELLQRFEIAPRGHGDLILPMVESLMQEADLRPAQLTALAFGCGPGAFTGVRIATSVAQGIAYAADLPVAPVSTLAALALAGHRQHGYSDMLCAVDARMGEIYWGAYQAERGVVSLLAQERVCRPESAHVPQPRNWQGLGNGWAVFGEVLRARGAVQVNQADTERLPQAAEVALLAEQAVRKGETVSAENAAPVYLRDDVAEKTKR